MADSDSVPPIVSCDWLKKQIDEGKESDFVLVDVSWSKNKNMQEEYSKSHISNAVYLNVMEAEHTDMYPFNLPSLETFEAEVRQAGINKDSRVVVYSDSDVCSYFASGRAWWTFRLFGHERVSVLDGGWPKWTKSGFPTTDSVKSVKPGNFKARRVEKLCKTFTDIEGNCRKPKFQVCDCRPPPKFAGQDETAGHIPGAKNVPAGKLVSNEKGVLLSADEGRKVFSDAGIDVSKPFAAYCNSGMTSCTAVLVAFLCGNKEASVYHGSWTEWSKKTPPEKWEK